MKIKLNLDNCCANTANLAQKVCDFLQGKTSLPAGGTAGQVLTKVDDADYNVEWKDMNTSGSMLPELPPYSTDEVLTCERWIDGKPIYRKVFHIADVNGGNNILGNIPNISPVVDNWIKNGSTEWDLTPSTTYSFSFKYEISTGNVAIYEYDGAAWNAATWTEAYFVLKYTKNSDTASSPTAFQQQK